MIMKKLLLLMFVAITITAFAQNLSVVSGNFNFLKDQKEVNVVVKFENVLFNLDNKTEAEYLESRKKDILKNPKKSKQDWINWNGEWQNFKNDKYLEYFLKGLGKSKKIIFNKESSSKYTLIVDTKWIFPGWHGGFVGQEAKLSSILKFVETDNPTTVVMELQGDGILGKPQNKDFVWEYGRIAGAYEATGKQLYNIIKKNTK